MYPRNDAALELDPAPDDRVTPPRLRDARRAVFSQASFSVATLFAGAFLVRSVTAQVVRPDPTRNFMYDASWNYSIARELAHGAGFTIFGLRTTQMLPGYPGSLAGLFVLFGTSLQAALTLNAALGALTCALTYLLARQLFDHSAGLIAGAIVLVLPSHVLLSTLLLSENLGAPLLLIALLFSFRVLNRGGGVAFGLAFGAVIGFGVLSRGEIGVSFAALLLLLLLSRTSLPRSARWLLPALLSMSVVVGAWVARNEVQMGMFAVSGSATTSMYGSLGPPFTTFDLTETVIHREGNPPIAARDREAYASRAEVRQIIEYARTHPGEELRRIPPRFWGYAGNDEGAVWWIRGDPQALSSRAADRLALVCNVSYFVLLGAALITLPFVLRRSDTRHILLLLVIVGWSALHTFVFTGEPHYHIPLLPLVSIIAAGGCVACWRQARDRIARTVTVRPTQ